MNSKGVDQIQTETTTALSVDVSRGSLVQLRDQRKLLVEFIKSELEDDVDFGVIPGTKKPSLWKPGAEKLANIFQLGSRIVSVDKTIDFEANLAIYTTRLEVFHLKTGIAIAQCEGACTSREKKYYHRTIYQWVNNQKEAVGTEETPIGDLLNTLGKMSLKRAYVGAVILATGASGFFTQDLEDMPDFSKDDHKPSPRAAPKGTPPIIKPVQAAAPAPLQPKEAPKPPAGPTRASVWAEAVKLGKQINWTEEDVKNFLVEKAAPADLKTLSPAKVKELVDDLAREHYGPGAEG